MDAIGWNLDFADSTEGEQQLHEILRRLFRSLPYDMGDGIRDRSLEHNALGLEASKVYPYDLARLKHIHRSSYSVGDQTQDNTQNLMS